MGNNATIFSKNAWQFIGNKETESIEETMGNHATIFTKNGNS